MGGLAWDDQSIFDVCAALPHFVNSFCELELSSFGRFEKFFRFLLEVSLVIICLVVYVQSTK